MAIFTQNALLLKQGTEVAGVHISVKKGETHDMSATITDIPLENGETIRDHVVLNPKKITVNFESVNTDSESPQSTFDAFAKMIEDREILELVTEHKTYGNVVLSSFSASHQAPFKGALQGTLTFEEIDLVKVVEIGRENIKKSTSSGHSIKSNTPKQNNGTVDGMDTTSSDNSTLLGNLADYLGGL